MTNTLVTTFGALALFILARIEYRLNRLEGFFMKAGEDALAVNGLEKRRHA